ncbi:TetR/AcrR family transcriptional regulator [Marinovum sp. 2_MG-2023]|uniref:TetR/AcrR family transcriptional regulator n=1 Tax=unclassified Marinovum TaxID=2647166 RepID=UPI0026E42583|nr:MULTISPECIES: TetR/AcrR family transcriptional regulator [unclassified Marinovum]MDO6731912.1 TetR/AcrR family transcriptional regulator [Marinovum sp. 2_MG-2023]MDO6781164.1 TetR/AcrR family transcriptional regulator [Marinovum sp. 1_MG-2023]
MTVSLRERRRQQTARDIQLATLELAVEQGLENVTTEEIAAAAGISTRTFFNYYVNKESAAIGAPPAFGEEDKTALREGRGALPDDLKRFLDKHIKILADDDNIVRMVGTVLRSNEKARGILDSFLMMERETLTECLAGRVADVQTAAALASMCTDSIGRAIFLWETGDAATLSAALDIVWAGTLHAAGLMVVPSD